MADGDARLAVVLEAKIDKLTEKLSAANRAVYGASAKMQKDLDAANGRWEKLFGKTDPAKALDKVFDSTRFRVLDTGAAKVGLFGSALETLGPVGLAAAAAIGAVAGAFAEAREAARFGDEINDTAAKLHVTTDALQEYRFAIRAAGGEQEGAETSLEAFSITLGKAQQGLTKSQRAFLALGFTKEQIKSFTDADSALRAVVARIAGLKSDAQKDAIISQLGLDGLKPLIEQGADEMARLRGEAHKAGVVMSADLVKRAGDLNDQFEEVADKIHVQLMSAFVDVGPVLLKLVQDMAKLAAFAADVADSFRSIDKRQTEHLQRDVAAREKRDNGPLGLLFRAGDAPHLAAERAELAKRAQEKPDAPPAIPHGNGSLADTTPGPKDDTAQRLDTAKAALAKAVEGELRAQQGLTENAEARGKIEQRIADAQLAGELARLEKQREEVNADEGISAAQKRQIGAVIDQAEAAEQAAHDLEQQKNDRDSLRASYDQWATAQDQVGQEMDATAQILAGLAETLAERRAIEAKALADRQREERRREQVDLERRVQDGSLDATTAKQIMTSSDERRSAERRQLDVQNAGPLEQYLRGIKDLDSEMQDASVSAIKALSEGLADAIVNAKSLGDVASSVFRQLITQILSAVIQKNVVGPILAVMGLPGFANGTPSAPGGLAIVGERGPELVNLPRGSQVIPNHELARMASTAPQTAAVTVHMAMQNDFRGAVMTDDLVQSFREYTDQAAMRAAATGSDLGYQRVMRRLQQKQANTLGRR